MDKKESYSLGAAAVRVPKQDFNQSEFFRTPFTTRDAAIICAVMLGLSLAAVSPVFAIAKIDSLIEFQVSPIDPGDNPINVN